MENILPYLFLGFISFLIGVLITRWIFKIDANLELQKKQYLLLRLIATKLGVESGDILQVDDPSEFAKRQRQQLKEAKRLSKN